MLTGQVDLNIPGQDFEDIKDRNNKLLTKLSLLILLGFIGQICFGSQCGQLIDDRLTYQSFYNDIFI